MSVSSVLLHLMEIQMTSKMVPEWEVVLGSSEASGISVNSVPNACSVRKWKMGKALQIASCGGL